MHNHWIHSTRLAALSLAFLLSSCGGALAQADASPAAYTQSGTQGVSLTWTIENLCFDGQLLALDVRTTPSDTRYAACNDVLGDYEDFAQADDVRANGLIPLGYYCEADVETDSPTDPILSIGSGWRDGSSAVQQIRWLLAPDEAARARSIHLFCGIMETPGQLATEDLYVLDIPAPNATTVAHVSVNTEQVKTDRIREVLLTQIGATTNVYVYYDRTGYEPALPLDFVWAAHPDAFVLHTAYDKQAQLCCYALSLPTAEIDWTSHTLPLRDLENDQLITIDLNTGIAM